jgi:hypothetical protein
LNGGWTFNIRCSGCTEPQADLYLLKDCWNGTFEVELDLYDLGVDGSTGNENSSASICRRSSARYPPR